MKTVTLITRLIRGGAQRIALQITGELRRHGVDARLWCGPETGPEGSLFEEASARGVPVRVFPHLVRRIDPRCDIRALIALRRALLEEQPGWIHTHSSKAGILGREAARMAGCARIIHTVHGFGFTPQTPRLLRALYVTLERREAAHTARLIFVSRADQQEGARLGIPASPRAGQWIPPGIDLRPFADRSARTEQRRRMRVSAGIPEDAPLGGFLGRLAPQKDPALVLDVARSLADSIPKLKWLLIGDGPLAGALRSRVEADPVLHDRVRLAGLKAEPAPWLAAMDFLLLPSRWEGAPLTLMEAMAAGVPVIASDLPGIRDLLPAAAGSLATPGRSDGFSAHVSALLEDPERLRCQSAAARAHAFSEFGIERMLERVLDVYGFQPDRLPDA